MASWREIDHLTRVGIISALPRSSRNIRWSSGGSSKSVSLTGGVIPAKDQDKDHASVNALINTYKQQIPIALFIDDKYENFPFDLKQSQPQVVYALLGLYWIRNWWGQ